MITLISSEAVKGCVCFMRKESIDRINVFMPGTGAAKKESEVMSYFLV